MENLVELAGVTKSFGSTSVLKGINLQVYPGRFKGLFRSSSAAVY